MYNFKKSLIAFAGLLLLLGGIALVTPHKGYGSSGTTSNAPSSQTQNVNVVNTPSVNAQQSGTWNVGITGTPTVGFASGSSVGINGTPTVGLDAGNNTVKFDAVNNTVKIDSGTPVLVRDVDNATHQPFKAFTGDSIDDGLHTGFRDLTTVPAGKVLVIEHVSLEGRLPAGQKLLTVSLKSDDITPAIHFFVPNATGTDASGLNVFIASEPVRMYFTAGQTVLCKAERDGTAGQALVDFSATGYFVNVP